MSTATRGSICRRWVRSSALGGAAVLLAALAWAETPPRYGETLEVRRTLFDVRVLDRHGEAVVGLGPRDFELSVDGEPVAVEAVEWSGPPPTPLAATALDGSTPAAAAEPAPRWVVLFFQINLHPSRATGLLRLASHVARLVDQLDPGDRVAVLTFRSHLALHLDFTTDREALRRAVNPLALLAEPAPAPPREGALLAGLLDPRAARAAARPERGLLLVARALAALPGSKSLALLGWGLGELRGGAVWMGGDYPAARGTLAASHTAVFALDLTGADWHSLEVGLQSVADDTGGFYAKTHVFPAAAMSRLRGALAGSYVLVFDRSTSRGGRHHVEVRVPSLPGATVLARATIDD